LSDGRSGPSGRWVLLSAALVGAAVLGGCSSPKNAATATTATGGATSTTNPHPTGATTTTIVGCTVPHYALSLLGTASTASGIEVTLGFRNTSLSTCTLSGFPAVELVKRSGAEISTTTVQSGTLPATDFPSALVSLGHEDTAYFNLIYADTGAKAAACPTAWAIQATAPTTSTRLRVSGRFKVCNATVTVSPLFGKGSPETQTTAPGLNKLTF
jgi:hypothetical protein